MDISLVQKEDDKLQSFNVEFDDNNDVYRQGECIQGYVKVVIRPGSEPIEDIHKLEIKCNGKARTEWKVEHVDGEDSRIEWFEKQEKYFEENITVMREDMSGEHSSKEKCHLEAGEHVFHFKFQVPVDIQLPSSFEGQHGYIRYKVRAKIDKPGFEQTTRRCFTVDAGVDLNNRPQLKQSVKGPSKSEDEKTVCCLCCASGPISLFTETNKGGYVPGETIWVTGRVENNSSRSIQDIAIKLVQKVDYRAQQSESNYTQSKTTQDTLIEQKEEGCGEYATVSFERIPLVVPCCSPSDLDICKIIDICYYIQVEADVTGTPFDLKVQLPITIGTIPLDDTYSIAFAPGEIITEQPSGLQKGPLTPIYKFAEGTQPKVIYNKRGTQYHYGKLLFAPKYPYFSFSSSDEGVLGPENPHANDPAYPPTDDPAYPAASKDLHPMSAKATYPPPTDMAAAAYPSPGDASYPLTTDAAYTPPAGTSPSTNEAAYPTITDAAYPPLSSDATYPPPGNVTYPPPGDVTYPADAAYPTLSDPTYPPPDDTTYPTTTYAASPPLSGDATYPQPGDATYPDPTTTDAASPPISGDATYPSTAGTNPKTTEAAYKTITDAAYPPLIGDATYPPPGNITYPPPGDVTYPADAAYPPLSDLTYPPPDDATYPTNTGAASPPLSGDVTYPPPAPDDATYPTTTDVASPPLSGDVTFPPPDDTTYPTTTDAASPTP